MELDYIAIGRRIRSYRMDRRLSQEKVSEMAGLTPAHYSHIETGNTKVSLPSLVSIANSLGVSLDDIVCDSLEQNLHVRIREIDMLLSDCSREETKALHDSMAASKQALRSLHKTE